MLVRDCMKRDPITLRPESDPLAGVAICKSGGFQHILVADANGRLIGVVSRTELERFLAEAGSPGVLKRQHRMEQVETQEVPVVRPDQPLEEALGLMTRNGITCLPVIDEGKLIGVVTKNDVLEFCQHDDRRCYREGMPSTE